MTPTPTEPLQTTWRRCAEWLVAALYLGLLLLPPLPLCGQLQLQDALLPAMGLLTLTRGESPVALLRRWWPLWLFLLLAAAATLLHGALVPRVWYEWLVFAYMAVLFLFYGGLPLPGRLCGWLAAALLAAVHAALLLELLLPTPGPFSFVSPQMDATAMPLLARRFAFTQGNPNLFGTLYAIPCALAARWAALTPPVSPRRRLAILALLPLLLTPLAWSASKHGLLSLALLLATAIRLLPAGVWRRAALTASLAALLVLAAAFETTVRCVTFPLNGPQGLLNTQTGMYALHQDTYARMLLAQPHAWLLGLGPDAIRRDYPTYADPETIRATLATYNALDSYRDFITFMDPHNEFLNLATLFGLPALLAAIACWLAFPARVPPPLRTAALLLALAVLACCLWDDLLSKRHLWLAAALLAAPIPPKHPQTPVP